MIILQPTNQFINLGSSLAVVAAVLMAVYGVFTRLAAEKDDAETSLFWAAIIGAVSMLAVTPFHWKPPSGFDWTWMALLCVIGAIGHYLLIKTLDTAKASSVQPFAYLQLVFGSAIGLMFFNDKLSFSLLAGCTLIVASGLFSMTFGEKEKKKKINICP